MTPCPFFSDFRNSESCQRYADFFQNESHTMASEYSLTDVLERFYQNQLALEAAVMELSPWAEKQNALELGKNVQRALQKSMKIRAI